MPRDSKALLALMIAVLAGVPAVVQAGGLTVTLKDQFGRPVADAAVLLDLPGQQAGPGETAIMDQRNRQFDPYVLVISPGTPVSFPNSDNIRHHVYSFSPAKKFELKLYSGTPTNPIVFPKAGLVTLGCNIHDWMLAFILVDDAARHAVTDASGTVHFDDLPAGQARLRVWQPRIADNKPIERPLTLRADGNKDVSVDLQLGPPIRRMGPEPGSMQRHDDDSLRSGRRGSR